MLKFKTLNVFFVWRAMLFVIAYLAILFIPTFGNTFPYANTVLIPTGLPSWIWSFGNFDGVHYLRIAQNGYVDAFYQAFFPLFPVLIKLFNFFPRDLNMNRNIFVDKSYFYIGFLLANLFLLVSLWIYRKISNNTDYIWEILLILSFPTAFYFGAIYTESLFLLLLILFLFFLSKKNFLGAGLVTALASLTKVTGVLFLVPLVIAFFKERKVDFRSVLSLVVAPLGLISYMGYLWVSFGNPLFFLTSQPGFGAGRSALPIVTLPQVFWRYFKMFVTVKDPTQFMTITNEFVFSAVILGIIIWSFKKVSIERWWLALLFYLVPTLTGTLSSMPRYVLFSYILLIPVIMTWPKRVKLFLVIVMWLIQTVLLSLFTRGYWIA
jgi:hypothetical protein